jgi:hypothetical protein
MVPEGWVLVPIDQSEVLVVHTVLGVDAHITLLVSILEIYGPALIVQGSELPVGPILVVLP